MAIFEGRLRIDILPAAIDFRVIGENGTAGVEDAMDEIDQLAADLKTKGIAHEVQRRKYHTGYRADAVVVMTKACETEFPDRT